MLVASAPPVLAVPVVSWTAEEEHLRPGSRRTRRTLLLAAARAFGSRGYHAASVRDILVDAELTKGALYFHFRSKEDLARALVVEVFRSWRIVVADLSSRGLDPLCRLLLESDAIVGRRMYDPVVRGASRAMSEAETFVSERQVWLHDWLTDIEGHLGAAAAEGVLRDDVDPARVARLVQAISTGHFALGEAVRASPNYWWRMSDMWEAMIPLITVDPWAHAWAASPWRSRPAPDPEAYARARRP